MKAVIRERGLDTLVEVDGGVNVSNAAHIMECGADVLVAGSAVFGGDIEANVKAIRAQMI